MSQAIVSIFHSSVETLVGEIKDTTGGNIVIRVKKPRTSKYQNHTILAAKVLGFTEGTDGHGEVIFRSQRALIAEFPGEVEALEDGSIAVTLEDESVYIVAAGTDVEIVAAADDEDEGGKKPAGKGGAKPGSKPAAGGKPAPKKKPKGAEALLAELEDDAVLTAAVELELTTAAKGKKLDREALIALFDEALEAEELEVSAIEEYLASLEEEEEQEEEEEEQEEEEPAPKGGKGGKGGKPAAGKGGKAGGDDDNW